MGHAGQLGDQGSPDPDKRLGVVGGDRHGQQVALAVLAAHRTSRSRWVSVSMPSAMTSSSSVPAIRMMPSTSACRCSEVAIPSRTTCRS